MQNIIKCKLKK